MKLEEWFESEKGPFVIPGTTAKKAWNYQQTIINSLETQLKQWKETVGSQGKELESERSYLDAINENEYGFLECHKCPLEECSMSDDRLENCTDILLNARTKEREK